MNKDQIPTFTVAEIRRFQDGKWGMPPAEVLLAHRLQEQDPTVQAAERVSAKFRELASVLQEWDTSAAEAPKAFQGLQEASKDLVDLEIVIPSGHQTDPTPLPRGTSLEWTDYMDQVAEEHDRNCSPEQEDDIDQALRDLPPEPWYKRLWSWLRGTK